MSRGDGSSTSLFVRNVPDGTSTDDLRQAFRRYGRLLDVYIPLAFHSRKPRGFAYVQFETMRDAEEARFAMDGVRFHGRVIEVDFAQGDRKSPRQMRAREGRRSLRSFSRSPVRRRSRSSSRRRSSYGKGYDGYSESWSREGRSYGRFDHRRSRSRGRSRSRRSSDRCAGRSISSDSFSKQDRGYNVDAGTVKPL